jgi:energy-converting hydrogenase Eha subunit F
MTIGRGCLLGAFVLGLLALSGCVVDGPTKPEPLRPQPVPRETTHPTKLIVSPLSRVGPAVVGGPSIQLHLDFRNADGKSIKAYGTLHIELYPPAPATGEDAKAPQRKAQEWDVDLSDPLANALMYDEMITRTYTLTLAQIAPWLVDWWEHHGSDTKDQPTVVVQFTPKPGSDDKVLRATYSLTR